MENWRHGDPYWLPVKPSPNLPNDQSIRLYPSLCFFEGTNISVGRGTYYPFQILGAPDADTEISPLRPPPCQVSTRNRCIGQGMLRHGLERISLYRGIDAEIPP